MAPPPCRSATNGGFPNTSLLLPAGRVHPICIAQGTCSLHARGLTQIGPAEAALSSSRVRAHLDARLPSECARFDEYFCAHGRLLPLREPCQVKAAWTHLVPRREARSRQITGLARWNATDRSDLRSRTDANALRRHYRAGIRPDWRGIGRCRRAPVGMAPHASQRPIGWIAASGSERFRLLTFVQRCQHAMPAKICTIV